MWAVGLGLFMAFMAAATARADTRPTEQPPVHAPGPTAPAGHPGEHG